MELKGNISLHYLVNKAAVGRMHASFHHIRWSPLGPAAEGARCPVKPHPCSHHGEPLQDPVPLECAPSSSLWPRGRSPQAAEAAVTPSNSETKDQHTTQTHTLHCPVIIVNTSIMASNIMSLKLCALLWAEEGLENVLDLQDFPQLKPSEGICTHICICRAATKSPVMSEIFWSLKPDLRRDQMSVFLLRSLESQ